VLAAQLAAYDQATAKRKDNPIFREIEESQKVFAQRAVRFNLDYNVSPRMAYNHYFGRKPAAKKA
jgi:TRAP-type mannitol/chloroaromatic compound transport system substrate-binding protein